MKSSRSLSFVSQPTILSSLELSTTASAQSLSCSSLNAVSSAHSVSFNTDRYQLIDLLSNGFSHSTVYSAIATQHPSASDVHDFPCAIKLYNKRHLNRKQLLLARAPSAAARACRADPLSRGRNEGHTLRRLCHANIVRLLHVVEDTHYLALVLEYLPGGPLMHVPSVRAYPECEARHYFRQLVDALEYLHVRQCVVHGDIKPANILLCRAHTSPRTDQVQSHDHTSPSSARWPAVKLADFGSCVQFGRFACEPRLCHDGLCQAQMRVLGTPAFMALEALGGGTCCGCCADVWALGVTLYCLLTGQCPYPQSGVVALADTIGAPDSLRFCCVRHTQLGERRCVCVSSSAQHLLSAMICVDVRARLTLPQIKSHVWYSS